MEKIIWYAFIGLFIFIAALFAFAYLVFLGKIIRDLFCAIFNIGSKRKHLAAKAGVIIGILSFPFFLALLVIREKYLGMQTNGEAAGGLLLISFVTVMIFSFYLHCVEGGMPRATTSYHGCCHPDDCDGNMGITDPDE
jgi:hypothetical protein